MSAIACSVLGIRDGWSSERLAIRRELLFLLVHADLGTFLTVATFQVYILTPVLRWQCHQSAVELAQSW